MLCQKVFLALGFLCADAAVISDQQEETITWVEAGTGDKKICGGIKQVCEARPADCTWHAFGPCPGDLKEPTAYISAKVIGMARISDASTYLTDNSKITMIKREENTIGYRDDTEVDEGTYKYSFMTAGGFVGKGDNKAYVGMAIYIMQSGSLSTDSNNVTVPEDYNESNTTQHEVCISDIENGACGAKRNFTAGDYKFSLFGYTDGDNWETATAYGFTHFGFRTEWRVEGAKAEVTINGDKTPDNIGHDDVKNVTLSRGARAVTVNFMEKYNIGTTSNAATWDPTDTKDVKIRISRKSNGALYVDYLFEVLDGDDQYFIYDPTVTATQGDEPDSAAAEKGVFLALFAWMFLSLP